MTKIDIFSGFLGAGKTTLIKKLINEAFKGEKLVLIENEFGEIGIDGGFLKDAGIEITEMNSGCICCSLVGDFGKALKQVLDTYHPDRILIEPSGVGKLSDVIRAVRDIDDKNAVLNSFTTVANANKCKMYMKNFGEFFGDQLEHANCIVLSHTDDISDEKIKSCLRLLREHNKDAVIVTTPWNQLDGKQLLDAMQHTNTLENQLENLKTEDICPECGHSHSHVHACDGHEHEHHHDHSEDCQCGCHDHKHEHHHHHHDEHHHEPSHEQCHEHEHHHDHGEDCQCGCHDHKHEHHHHHADEVFTSWGAETARKFNADEIKNALLQFENNEDYGMILRAKGIVAAEDGSWIHFDYIPGTIDVRTGSADITGRLCVIGSKIDKDKISLLFGI